MRVEVLANLLVFDVAALVLPIKKSLLRLFPPLLRVLLALHSLLRVLPDVWPKLQVCLLAAAHRV